QDAGLEWKNVEALVIGKAPDMFEGVMQPELYLADALGAAGKPMIRVHTAGSVGGSTAIVAAHLVQSGQFSRVLTVAFEKQSESEATWAITPKIPFQPPLVAGAGRRGPASGGQGQEERDPQSPRASSPARHRHRDGRELAAVVGPAPLSR